MTVSGFFPTTVIGPFRAAGQIEQWDLTKPDPSGFRHWESGQYKPSAKGILELPIDGTKPPDGLVGGFQAQKESGNALNFGETIIVDAGFVTGTVAITFNLGEVNFNPASFFDIMVSDNTVGTEFKAANMRFWLDKKTTFTDLGYDPEFFFLTANAWTESFSFTSGTVGALPVPSSMPNAQNIFTGPTTSGVFVSGSYIETEFTHYTYVMAHFPNEPSGYVLGTYGGLGSGNFSFKLSYDWTGIDARVRINDFVECRIDNTPPPFVSDPVASGLDDDVQAYWNMTETGGTRIDGPGILDLTENGTVGNGTGPDGGVAVLIDGDVGDYLSHADDAILSVGDRDYTWCGWIFVDDVANTYKFFSKYTVTGDQREYQFDYQDPADSELRFLSTRNGTPTFNPNTTGLRESSSVITATTWHFVVIWHDMGANTLSLQVDNSGTIDSVSTNGGLGIHDGTTEFRFGTTIDDGGATTLSGRLAKWGIFHKILSVAEKTFLYNSGSGKNWPFDV